MPSPPIAQRQTNIVHADMSHDTAVLRRFFVMMLQAAVS